MPDVELESVVPTPIPARERLNEFLRPRSLVRWHNFLDFSSKRHLFEVFTRLAGSLYGFGVIRVLSQAEFPEALSAIAWLAETLIEIL
jgi:hypothetical protein